MSKRRWVWARKRVRVFPSEIEKVKIIAACDKFVAEVLAPRFLPEVRSTEFNYPVALYGKWHGGRYRFIERFHSDSRDATEPEFEHAFTRLDYIAPDCLYHSVSLTEALRHIEQNGHLHPL
jgi:hypothetical protein